MTARVFWMADPEGGAVRSPFVRQPAYNDLEVRVQRLETAYDAVCAELARALCPWKSAEDLRLESNRRKLPRIQPEFCDGLHAPWSK